MTIQTYHFDKWPMQMKKSHSQDIKHAHQSKQCFKCNASKPLSDFYRHPQMGDGHLNKCKQCTKDDVKKYRRGNAEKLMEYEKQRSRQPHRVYARNQYQKTPLGKQAHERSCKRDRVKHSDKYAARNALNNAVRDGKVNKPTKCSCCGKECNPHGHHEDYQKPLEVIWLCAACHAIRHSALVVTS